MAAGPLSSTQPSNETPPVWLTAVAAQRPAMATDDSLVKPPNDFTMGGNTYNVLVCVTSCEVVASCEGAPLAEMTTGTRSSLPDVSGTGCVGKGTFMLVLPPGTVIFCGTLTTLG